MGVDAGEIGAGLRLELVAGASAVAPGIVSEVPSDIVGMEIAELDARPEPAIPTAGPEGRRC